MIKAFGANIDKEDPRALWKTQMLSADIYAGHLLTKRWLLLKSERQFYLSDNPVALSNFANPPGLRGTLGINSDGIEIYLPLSSSVVLNLLCGRFYADVAEGTHEVEPMNIEYCNSLQIRYAERFIFSATNDFALASDMLASQ
jgi:hypothetical protein